MSGKKTDDILYSIRTDIQNGSIQHDQLILEQRVAEQYGISKITAREILQKLCHEKYLKSFPRKGYLIYDITPEECKKIQQVRYQIESLSIKLIIKNATDEEIKSLIKPLANPSDSMDPYSSANSQFHLYMAQLSGNQYIYDTIYSFIGYVTRYANTSPVFNGFTIDQSYHNKIVSSMLKRDYTSSIGFLQKDLRLSADDI